MHFPMLLLPLGSLRACAIALACAACAGCGATTAPGAASHDAGSDARVPLDDVARDPAALDAAGAATDVASDALGSPPGPRCAYTTVSLLLRAFGAGPISICLPHPLRRLVDATGASTIEGDVIVWLPIGSACDLARGETSIGVPPGVTPPSGTAARCRIAQLATRDNAPADRGAVGWYYTVPGPPDYCG
jgi:hypothetical protein